MKNRYHNAKFLLSAANLDQLPEDTGYEIAFVGRSNAGKSSVLNVLCNQKNLARTSKTPGRTQLINTFPIDDDHRLMDLPGYGYAKVPEKVQRDWQQLLSFYFEERQSLRGLILIMDIRHPFTEYDHVLINFASTQELPVHILLNKSDKLSRNELFSLQKKIEKEINQLPGQLTLQSFSALKKEGLEDLIQVVDSWMAWENN